MISQFFFFVFAGAAVLSALLVITRVGYTRLGRFAYVLFFLSLLLLLPAMIARLGGHDAWVPFFGRVLQVGVIAFGVLLAIGLTVGAYHTVYWLVRTALKKPAPGWGEEPSDAPEAVDS